MTAARRRLTPRMITDFCRLRIGPLLPPIEADRLRQYLLNLLAARELPPRPGHRPDWQQVAEATGIEVGRLVAIEDAIAPVLDALRRDLARRPRVVREKVGRATPAATSKARTKRRPKLAIVPASPSSSVNCPPTTRKPPGPRPKPIVAHPEPLFEAWQDPETFAAALKLHMQRYGDSAWQLHRAVVREDENFDRRTLTLWCQGRRTPRSVKSLEILRRIEKRYRLPVGYFKAKLPHPTRGATGHCPTDISPAERRRLAWHLPDDFNLRPCKEQEEILSWVRTVIISGATDYRRFQAAAMRHRFAIRFRGLEETRKLEGRIPTSAEHPDDEDDADGLDPELRTGVVDAPPQLEREMAELVRFKTATLTVLGYQRHGVWGEETTAQKTEHLGLMFGALAASPKSAVRGYGVPRESLCFGMLVFPAVWDRYVQWRERRRGFYTAWEVDMLRTVLALTRRETGWLRQSPRLGQSLRPIPDLITVEDIAAAQVDWQAACDRMHAHGSARAKEIQRVVRVHRDPFEPILPILEAESPVGEYRKITDEILRLMPDERRYPLAAAEAVRSFLMLRLGLHLGLRQKNLRQLLVSRRPS